MAHSDIPKIDKLNKSNYALWKFNMSNFLAGKTWNKLTDGSVTLANNPQADAEAKTAIGFSLDPEHLAMVVHCPTSKEMWYPCLKGTPLRDQQDAGSMRMAQLQVQAGRLMQ